MNIDDVDPTVDKEVRKYLSVAGTRWVRGIAAYGIWRTKPLQGQKSAYYGGYGTGAAPCHHYLRDIYSDVDFIMVAAMKAVVSKEHEDFVLWVCQQSPYAYAVLNRDNSDELLNNGMVIDGRLCGKGGALWLCKALRSLSERPDKAKNWKKLVDVGVEPLLAFCGASMLRADGGPETMGHHCSLFPYRGPKAVKTHLDHLRKGEKNTTQQAAMPSDYTTKDWGSMLGTPVQKPDGWGGYIQELEQAGPEEYAALLIKIDKDGKL